MNVWKPIAICLGIGLVASIGIQTASASKSPDPQPADVAGPCFDQPHMAAAKGGLENALGQLRVAEHNKGGWRDAAISHAQQALDDTNRGCAVANR